MSSKPSIGLLVGLGNPGPTYQETRHNAGACLVEMLCEQFKVSLKTDSKFAARIAKITLIGQELKLLIPNTYMNLSGQAVSSITKYYQIPVNSILIAHDDLDLPCGSIRLKTDGGHGGHNGLRNIIDHLNNRHFHRLRIGIGHPGHKDQVLDYVLKKPSKQEETLMKKAIEEALFILPDIVTGHWQKAMNYLHCSPKN